MVRQTRQASAMALIAREKSAITVGQIFEFDHRETTVTNELVNESSSFYLISGCSQSQNWDFGQDVN